MAFNRPTLTELAERIQQDFVSRLQLAAPILRRSFIWVASRVIAGAVHLLHGFLQYLSRQVFPDLSAADFLVRQAALYGITKTPAAFATGNVVTWGTNGSVVPIDTVLVRADGAEYQVTMEKTVATLTGWASAHSYSAVGELCQNGGNAYEVITAGTSAGSGGPTGAGQDITDNTVHWRYIGNATAAVAVPVIAVVAGVDGSCEMDVSLSFESPISGVNAAAPVAATDLSGGADEETTDALRARVIDRIRNPPHGGNEADYVAWAKEVAGVTRAWCYPLEGGAGTVTVRFVRDNDSGSIIPDSGEVTAVQDHIDAMRPVTADVTVAAPIADALNYTIHIVPDTTANRAAVEAELRDMLLRDSEPGGTILLSHIRGAIDEVVDDWNVSVPASDVTHTTGHIATHGTVTWA